MRKIRKTIYLYEGAHTFVVNELKFDSKVRFINKLVLLPHFSFLAKFIGKKITKSPKFSKGKFQIIKMVCYGTLSVIYIRK